MINASIFLLILHVPDKSFKGFSSRNLKTCFQSVKQLK